MELIWLCGGLALLIFALWLNGRMKERAMFERIKRAGNDVNAVLGELDRDIAAERARGDEWLRLRGGIRREGPITHHEEAMRRQKLNSPDDPPSA